MAHNLPTKKQQELLRFIDGFIKGNGYAPSYRETARALGYKSVSTVAIHVDSLIAKGFLRKGDEYSARSLEVVTPDTPQAESAGIRALRHEEEKLRTAGRTDDADIVARAIAILTTPEPAELA